MRLLLPLQALILGASAVLVQMALVEAVPMISLIGFHFPWVDTEDVTQGSTNGFRFLLVYDELSR